MVVPSYRAAILGWLACGVLAGCAGPGLEPPWSDDESRAGGTTTAPSAGPGGGIPVMAPSPGAGSSGAGGSAAPSAGMAAPGAINDPFGNAGNPQATPPVTPTPTSPDPMTAAGSGAGMAAAGAGPASPPDDAGELFSGVDFVPQCDTEQPSALMSSDACRYPLPMDLDPSTTRVAVLTADTPALLQRHFDAFGCLVGDGYFVDATGMPPAIVLCPATCAGLAMDAQLVVVEGCPPPTEP